MLINRLRIKETKFNGKYWYECKNQKEHNECEKDYIRNRSTCICESGKYLANSINKSVITCDETAYATDSVSTDVTDTIQTQSSRGVL